MLPPRVKPNIGMGACERCGAPCRDGRGLRPFKPNYSTSVAVKSLAQPLQLEADTEQREQARHKEDAAPGRERDVRLRPSSGRCLKTATENKALPKMKLRRPRNKSRWLSKTLGRRNGMGTHNSRHQNASCIRQKTPTVTRSEKASCGSCLPGLITTCSNSGSCCQTKAIAPVIWIATSSR